MNMKNIPKMLIDWTINMLENRKVIFDSGAKKITVKTSKGCPQGGALVIDELIQNLDDPGYDAHGYVDDLVMVRGKFDSIITDRMQLALDISLVQRKGSQHQPEQNNVSAVYSQEKTRSRVLKPGSKQSNVFRGNEIFRCRPR